MLTKAEVCQTLLDLGHPEPAVRRTAAALVSRNHTRFPAQMVHKAFDVETDPLVRTWLALSLGLAAYRPALASFDTHLAKADAINEPHREWTRVAKNMVIGERTEHRALDLIVSSNLQSRLDGLTEGFHISKKDSNFIRRIERLASCPDVELRRWAVMILARTQNYRRISLFLGLLRHDNDPVVREWSAWGMGFGGLRRARVHLDRAYDSETNARVREWIGNSAFDLSARSSMDIKRLIERYRYERDALAKEGLAKRLILYGGEAGRQFIKSELWNYANWQDYASSGSRILLGTLIKIFFCTEMLPEDFERAEGLLKVVGVRDRTLILNAVLAQKDIPSSQFLHMLDDGRTEQLLSILKKHRTELVDIASLADEVAHIMPVVMTSEVRQRLGGDHYQSVLQMTHVEVRGVAAAPSISQSIVGAFVSGNVVQMVRGDAASVGQQAASLDVGGHVKQVVRNLKQSEER